MPDDSRCAGWPTLTGRGPSAIARNRDIAVERQPGALVLTLVCNFSSLTPTARCHAETWLHVELGGVTPTTPGINISTAGRRVRALGVDLQTSRALPRFTYGGLQCGC
jgi:hypothetical protein